MKEWDDKEQNGNYSPPSGKAGKGLRIMLIGSITLFVAYIASYAMEWAFTAPKVAP